MALDAFYNGLRGVTRCIGSLNRAPPVREVPRASNHIPPNARCVPKACGAKYCYRGAVSSSGTKRQSSQAF